MEDRILSVALLFLSSSGTYPRYKNFMCSGLFGEKAEKDDTMESIDGGNDDDDEDDDDKV